MKGAVLRQVGGAKVVGINFSARTTLEVREWPDVSYCTVWALMSPEMELFTL
jgi:hypothetical protein